LLKILFKIKYLANLLWIVWYDYMRICEWLLGVEYDVYHNVLYFLLYLNCEKLYEDVVMLVDSCDNDYVNDNIVMTLIWIVTCWLCGRKYLIMQLCGVDQCKWRWTFTFRYEVVSHCRVFACISMHHSHVESHMWCKSGVYFYIGEM